MKSFFVALIEADSHPDENDGQRFVKAINEFKEAGKTIGEVTYYRVLEERQYRRAEKEFKAQVK